VNDLTFIALHFALVVLVICWSEIRWWRYAAKTWEDAADRARDGWQDSIDSYRALFSEICPAQNSTQRKD
jgi:hypothetical protein